MENRIAADLQAVLRDLVDIDQANLVGRVDQLVLEVPGQVAEVEEAKAAVAEQEAQAARIVAGVDGLWLMFAGNRVFGGPGLFGHHFARAAQAR